METLKLIMCIVNIIGGKDLLSCLLKGTCTCNSINLTKVNDFSEHQLFRTL